MRNYMYARRARTNNLAKMKLHTGVPVITRLVAHITIVAALLLVGCTLSAQTSVPQTRSARIDRLVSIAAPSFELDAEIINAHDSDDLARQTSTAEISITDVGVLAKRNLVYVTLDATEDVVATVDVYEVNGALVARVLDRMPFSRGRQRFGIDLPARIPSGTYRLSVSTPRGVASKSFVVAR